MTVFRLPDLGEGLSEAEIVRWHVKTGEHVDADTPLLSVETAKAVVEVPSPVSGTVLALHAQPGDRIEIGAPLVEFAPDEGTEPSAAGAPRAAGTDAPAGPPGTTASGAAGPRGTASKADRPHPTGTPTHADAGAAGAEPAAPLGTSGAAAAAAAPAADAGTVVGRVTAPTAADSAEAALEAANAVTRPRVRAVPAARALARSLGIELGSIRGTGAGGLVTLEDVMAAGLPSQAPSRMRPASTPRPPAREQGADIQALHSLRRAMAESMALSRDSVMACSVFDDADLQRWRVHTNYTTRVLRAIAAATRVEPGLNAWYDAASQSRTLFEHVDVGIAVDTPDGLLVPVIRHVERLGSEELRAEVDRLKRGAHARTLTSEELRHFTFILSNYGMMAGRYATPVVVPPAVAILGTGRARQDVLAVRGQLEIHTRMPLSLTFDHRVVTGGEAVRFLGAVIADLERAE